MCTARSERAWGQDKMQARTTRCYIGTTFICLRRTDPAHVAEGRWSACCPVSSWQATVMWLLSGTVAGSTLHTGSMTTLCPLRLLPSHAHSRQPTTRRARGATYCPLRPCVAALSHRDSSVGIPRRGGGCGCCCGCTEPADAAIVSRMAFLAQFHPGDHVQRPARKLAGWVAIVNAARGSLFPPFPPRCQSHVGIARSTHREGRGDAGIGSEGARA